MWLQVLLLSIGLVLLTYGAEWFVKGASRMASALGIPSLIIGLTLVAFGTSAPELAVSLKGVFAGQTDVTIGNVVGSNILNVLLILGLAAVITPLAVQKKLAVKDVPFMIAVSALMWWFSNDLVISLLEGVVLFSLLNGYMFSLYLSYRKQKKADAAIGEFSVADSLLEEEKENPHWLKNISLVLLGASMLVGGSELMVTNAIEIAQFLGMSTLLISLTIVAIGTSLPEIATSVIAAIRGEGDIAVGNIVGSNLFNILLVLGLSAIIAPDGIALNRQAFDFDIPFMFWIAVLCLPFFYTHHHIHKAEGFFFLSFYVLYTLFLIAHNLYPSWETALYYAGSLLLFATLLFIGYSFYQHIQSKK